jgi:hypothetical protein
MDPRSSPQLIDVQPAHQSNTLSNTPTIAVASAAVSPPMSSQPAVTQPLSVQDHNPATQMTIVQPNQPMMQMANQPIILSYRKPTRSRIRKRYKGKLSRILGITQIVCGAVMIVTQVTGHLLNEVKRNQFHYYNNADAYRVWSGIWCAVFVCKILIFTIWLC